ncbi:uncharacterized protein [Euwallacea similis]|uniref:uncharacterized protein n=1 Tax=Euwallacea similis TaxID=1736056 RepID=UPI00344B6108
MSSRVTPACVSLPAWEIIHPWYIYDQQQSFLLKLLRMIKSLIKSTFFVVNKLFNLILTPKLLKYLSQKMTKYTNAFENHLYQEAKKFQSIKYMLWVVNGALYQISAICQQIGIRRFPYANFHVFMFTVIINFWTRVNMAKSSWFDLKNLCVLLRLRTLKRDDKPPATVKIGKMDMKKLIKDFRHFQRERKKAKLLKTKMSRYTVKYQKGAQPILQDVTVEMHQRANIISFRNSNGERLDFLEDIDITTFDDTMNATIVLHIDEGAKSVSLEFINEETKSDFVAQLVTFLQLSNNLSAEEGSDSGRSTLS